MAASENASMKGVSLLRGLGFSDVQAVLFACRAGQLDRRIVFLRELSGELGLDAHVLCLLVGVAHDGVSTWGKRWREGRGFHVPQGVVAL